MLWCLQHNEAFYSCQKILFSKIAFFAFISTILFFGCCVLGNRSSHSVQILSNEYSCEQQNHDVTILSFFPSTFLFFFFVVNLLWYLPHMEKHLDLFMYIFFIDFIFHWQR